MYRNDNNVVISVSLKRIFNNDDFVLFDFMIINDLDRKFDRGFED